MTRAQIQKIKDELNAAWQSGKIHADEYFDTLDLIETAPELFFFEAARVLGKKIDDEKPDPGERAAKHAEAEIEKKIKSVYGTAAKELKATLKSLEKDFEQEFRKQQQRLMNGEITQDEYNAWVKTKLMRQKQVKEQIDQCTGVLLHANEKALGIVNQERLGVFAENANFQEYQINKDTGLNLMFSIYDESTVERLLRDNPDLLPPKKVNGKKDKAWNQSRITSAVTQAILQGDSIPDLARRIAAGAAGSNAASMMRYARTAMTAAQNAGRVEMLQRAQGMGIKCRKRWMATLDSRTRDSHADLDGEVVDVDDRFSNGLLYPGDPNGAPGEVYNCRCTMTYEYEGIDNALQERRDNETGEMIPYETYSEWKKRNAPEPEKKQEPRKAEKQPRKAAVDKLSQKTRDAIEMYTAGEEFHLDQEQLDEIAEAMEETDKPLYRVETGDRTATDYDLDIGDEFDFSQQVFESRDPENGALRSFTRSEDALPDLVGQVDDAVIYRTSGPVEQLPVDSLSQYDQAESLAFGNGWKVTGRDTIVIDGQEYPVIDIQQVRPEAEKSASDFDTIMKKANALQQSEISDNEEDKKNLLPMADEKLSDQAHRIFMSMTEEEERKLTRDVTLNISDLKTEQAEVFIPRIEDLAEAFDGRNVTGARTDEHDGILVAKWQGEYIVLDGNNRTNLAILKGQDKLDVMLLDLDDNSELRSRIEENAERVPVDGENITDTWHRRMDDFAFEIEDVINAQGFDGLPRIMDPEDFDKAVQASGFIAQRTYSATTQEDVDGYRDMLYNGKFYVDCSTGGAQYGQGMYCAADYTGKLSKGIKNEMAHYKELGDQRYGKPETKQETIERLEKYFNMPPGARKYALMKTSDPAYMDFWRSLDNEQKKRLPGFRKNIEAAERGELRQNKPAPFHTETFTLTPGAKIITYSELEQERTYGKIEQRIYESMSGTLSPPQAKAIQEWIKSDGEKEIQDKKTREIAQDIEERAEFLMAQDPGAYAAMLGYDAINAEGHGASSSYTVILNRTKCIFRRDKK